jgi:dienelactone hydrolase
VRSTGVAGARGVVGVKGAVIGECPLDAKRVVEHAADPARGFAWPYILALPTQVTAKALLVLPNNTGFATEDLELLRAAGTCSVAQGLDLAERLGTPVLVPLFPRPMLAGTTDNLYLHALTRAALATKVPRYARVDRQLVAMIDAARANLAKQQLTIDARVLIGGFSAAGSFSNRFALLHPDRTLAAAVGSPGGWPTVPVAADGNARLSYPVGVADLDKVAGARLDTGALAKVRFFFFLGADDLNDAVPFRDSFSAADEKLVMRRFGKTPVARWQAAQRLYERAKLTAEFKLYPGVAHSVTLDMRRDIETAFATALATASQ